MEKLCSECGLPLVLKPAGVARTTGRPYDAFWACSSGQRHKQSTAQFVALINAPKPSPTNQTQRTGELLICDKIDALEDKLDKFIGWLENKLQ